MQKPEGFSWVVTDCLAAMSRPRELRKAVEFLQEEGIGVIVSLTESPLNASILEEFDIEYHHIPVEDFAAPNAAQVDEFVTAVTEARARGKKAVVHCYAGRGRTGTMLACYLVSLGRAPEEAIEEVRSLRPGSIETDEQEETVRDYARRLQHRPRH